MKFYFQDGAQEVILQKQITWPEKYIENLFPVRYGITWPEKNVWEFIWLELPSTPKFLQYKKKSCEELIS